MLLNLPISFFREICMTGTRFKMQSFFPLSYRFYGQEGKAGLSSIYLSTDKPSQIHVHIGYLSFSQCANIIFLFGITTFFQPIFLRKIVYMVRYAMGQHRILLLTNPMAIPNIYECIQFFLQNRYHKECKKHPKKKFSRKMLHPSRKCVPLIV